ncbi:MAG TPA: ribulose-phosphate 3-epimerase [Firmicutes bacterium]|nr:ribulose-phosphate 3-epimerase [Candidatus Fermentithermobacillaceae bacterium]
MSNVRTLKVAPSLLSADPLMLSEEVDEIMRGGADLLHLDIMDGHFVPNLTFGPHVARALASKGLPLDVHLMVDQVEWAIMAFSGYAEYITVHVEATPHLHRMLRLIRESGCKSGVALNPSTPPDFLPYVLTEVDLILIMTVNPGWGAQKFIPEMTRKIRYVRDLVDSAGVGVEIEVDGGIEKGTAGLVREAGATILVSGNYVFGSRDKAAAIKSLRESTNSGR